MNRFESLASIAGSLHITTNAALTNLSGLDSLDANLVEAPRLLELPLEFARSTNFKVETCEDDAPVDGGAAFDRRGVSTTARPARGESPPPALSPARVPALARLESGAVKIRRAPRSPARLRFTPP